MLKKFKLTDYVILGFCIIALIVGFFAFIQKKNFSNLPIEKETTIYFDVFFRGITMSSAQTPFKIGDDAFITIRNVPYTKLKIVDMDGMARKTIVSANNKEGFIVTDDPATPNLYDFIIKLKDTAKKTSDGYVAGGNKIKMGVPVIIEGEKYKYHGTVSNVYEADEVK